MDFNLAKYKKDIDKLIKKGEKLLYILSTKKDLIKFWKEYEIWYSESLSLVKIILPDRREDFEKYYYQERELFLKNNGFFENLDFFENLGDEAKKAMILFENQLSIVKAAKKRFETSLFDIKQLLQADLFDSELDAARELNNKGFIRGAGAIAGVVLEKHLSQVCKKHNLKVIKKNPTINDFNQILKDKEVIDIPTWRSIQHLADLRNLCDHEKEREPKKEEIEDLINGVEKIIKNIF
jgi:hypothetical protein